ncbi:hypothetical protein L9F63_022381, partial [Diploptera punctata]
IYNWAELVPTLIVYGATMVVGIAGNSLIIFTICRYRRMKSTTNVFLASLASADLLLIIICIPVKSLHLSSWKLADIFCSYANSIELVQCVQLTLTPLQNQKKICLHVSWRYRCTSCERSLNYATKMARMLQSSTSMSSVKLVLAGNRH